jgi:hypothetical protein
MLCHGTYRRELSEENIYMEMMGSRGHVVSMVEVRQVWVWFGMGYNMQCHGTEGS